jgi:thiol:disulfide interchange protein DsbD
MKKLISLIVVLMIAVLAHAQMANPVKFSTQLKTNGTAEAEIVFNGKISSGWHVYSTGLGNDGPISATFNVEKIEGASLVGKLQARGHEISKFDKLFNMNLRFFEGKVQFVQKIKFTHPNYHINGYLEYGACNDQSCLPPSSVDFKSSGKVRSLLETLPAWRLKLPRICRARMPM